jgi:hypothetical protein
VTTVSSIGCRALFSLRALWTSAVPHHRPSTARGGALAPESPRASATARLPSARAPAAPRSARVTALPLASDPRGRAQRGRQVWTATRCGGHLCWQAGGAVSEGGGRDEHPSPLRTPFLRVSTGRARVAMWPPTKLQPTRVRPSPRDRFRTTGKSGRAQRSASSTRWFAKRATAASSR